MVKVWLARQMGVANAKDTTARADRAETSEGIFRMKEGYGDAMGLMDRKEEQTKNKNQIFISFHQSKSTPPEYSLMDAHHGSREEPSPFSW
jgi:hypothetical protein